MNELIVYDNKLNSLILKDFKDSELKLFFAICSRLKDKGTNEVSFSYSYLRELTREKKHYSQDQYAEVIRSMYRKLLNLRFVYSDQTREGEVVLFEAYERSLTNNSFSIRVTPSFAYMFNQLSSEFTIFSLPEFMDLPGIYTKQLYRLLKQWRTVGHASYLIKDFRLLMDVPKSYQTRDMTKRVVAPAVSNLIMNIKEFRTLRFEYSRLHGKGPAVRIIFTWKPEPRNGNYKGKTKNTSDFVVDKTLSEVIPPKFIAEQEIHEEKRELLPVIDTKAIDTNEPDDTDNDPLPFSSKKVDIEWLEKMFGDSE